MPEDLVLRGVGGFEGEGVDVRGLREDGGEDGCAVVQPRVEVFVGKPDVQVPEYRGSD